MEASPGPALRRWETPLSDLKELYLSRLFEDYDGLRYEVKDQTGQRYQIALERPGPYRMSDEQHLVHYWTASPPGCGWTFKVENPTWIEDLMLLDVFVPDAELYVVATLDACLEVLSTKEPRVTIL